ncbi:uncharacterized protein N7473_006213 [Penicillium subrubescens]|uniref:Arrestin-like N-terminal domain-containing protein n=1 Tax=Penicillium subrubescens TaxID=1316194 RepID=A0A1Q5UEQ5_9EURO|nr:uncharacterized protein N7473_006213 [Penicillium subrubescens]KAJ5896814.1 hypothetical protein N7473_006213 [Penicillium subrubescens]OKP10960.1 hypothetical protein PENSUB_3780 [Penicillium subrubescens]
MPVTIRKSSPDLKFDVAAPAGWSYAAGDTIIGNLIRHTPIITPEAAITLTLIGRMKTKITESKSNDSRTNYRSEALLVKSDQTIFSGRPLHLPEGSGAPLSWEFSVNIPNEPLQSVRRAYTPRTSFVPLDRDHPAHNTLPGSFVSSRDGMTVSSTGFVEYYLKAQLRYTFKGSSKSVEAIWPFRLVHPVDETAASQLSTLKRLSYPQRILSQRLLPGMQQADLTLKQKTQKFFGSSKVPKLCFSVDIHHPAAIQLDNPQPIPIILEIRPLPDQTSPSVEDQTIGINWVRMTLHQRTSVLAPSNFLSDYPHDDGHPASRSLNLESAFRRLESPLVMSTGEKGEKKVNIGEMFQLVLRSTGFASGSRYLTSVAPIPDFTTYSIRHVNTVEWKVAYSVAGETGTVKATSPMKIIAAA